MKFLAILFAIFAFICTAWALECPKDFSESAGVCGRSRPVHGNCPDNTKYDINKNLCVLK
jgi:hypothetical protein